MRDLGRFTQHEQAEPRPPAYQPTPSQLAHDADTFIQPFLPPSDIRTASTGSTNGIPLPLCIPQVASSFTSPFARGYNPVLEISAGISQDQLLAFIDGLNLAMTASPPLRVVDLAAHSPWISPDHSAMIGGALLQGAAEAGTHILNKTLTDRYMRAANQRLFGPKGLAVRICTTAAMLHLVMRTEKAAGPSRMDKIGRGIGAFLLTSPITIPLSGRIVRAIADKAPKVEVGGNSSGTEAEKPIIPLSTQRRLAALEGHALGLDFNVPPPVKPHGIMDKLGSWSVAFDSRNTRKSENKAEKRRHRLARVEEQLRAARAARGREKGPGLLNNIIGPTESKLERKVANADLLEYWASDKILWIVIMNTEMDHEIEGVQRADSMDNEEHIDDDMLKSALMREKHALEHERDRMSSDRWEYSRH
ncbi:hypothetical protein R3P38DRAFT_2536107 [Favolaschia claudopus]|uniref:Uncharacterized protein n=1 Tax=Favolaschia claudopus TaxID=2862362 RepID=A0AAW0B426_9AGAR